MEEIKWKYERAMIYWQNTWYAPIKMEFSTIQTHCIELSAAVAWDRFCKITGQTKEDLKKQGYLVKRIFILPGFKR